MNARSRSDIAAEWFLRLREDASEEELREWMKWCAADPENLREYERMRTTWLACGQTAAGSRPRAHRVVRHRGLLAASVAALALAVAGMLAWQAGLPSSDKQMLSTHRPANRPATLPDGSTLTLAPHTHVAVDYSGELRSLELSHGEAFFDVEPDAAKPFVVRAAGLEVTAIGTAFSVRSEEHSVVVTVAEGVIEAANGSESWRVAAGHRIEYDLEHESARIASVDWQRELGWREGRLEYMDEPLARVIAEASRYSARRIELADPALGELAYTGTIFTDALDDWLHAVESTFAVRVEMHPDRVVLHASEEAAPNAGQ